MKINGYSIIDKIADGGMATVYLAEEQESHERIALKVLLPEKSSDPALLQRFLDEAEILAKLEHPYIIPVVHVGQSDDHAYMAMEYIPGGNLREKILSGVTESEILAVITQVAEALGYTHLKGVLHLDVTPRNILFKNNGVAVLADFGISRKYLELDFESDDSVMGNPRYMSPEQIKGEKTDPKTDLYSLGIIFYQMLTGHLPYEAETGVKTARMHLYEVPVPLPAHYSHYQTIIDQLLEKIPERRFHSSKDFLNALGELHSSASVLDDKTVIYPLKQTANGQVQHGGRHLASVSNDTTFITDTAPEELESFLDQTDPLSVEEVISREEKTELIQEKPDEIAKKFIQSKETAPVESDTVEGRHLEEIAEQFSLPVQPSSTDLGDTQIVRLRTDHYEEDDSDSDDALLKIEPDVVQQEFVADQSQAAENDDTGEFLIDPNVLVAVRDDISTPEVTYVRRQSSLLNILFVVVLIAGAIWLWEHYRENIMQLVNQAIQPSVQEESPLAKTDIPAVNQDKSLPVNPPPHAPAKKKQEVETEKPVSSGIIVRQEQVQDRAPSQQPVNNTAVESEMTAEDGILGEEPALPGIGDITALNKPGLEEPAIDSVLPLTEIVLKPDTGIMLQDDQFVISNSLERTIESHAENLVREFDGSLRVLLDEGVIYDDRSRAISQNGLKLLSRLAYVFRNNQDFKVQVVDRTLQVDNIDSRFNSLSKADNIRDFLIGQGLSDKRIVSSPNSQSYRNRFSGIEIRLIPEILLEPTES